LEQIELNLSLDCTYWHDKYAFTMAKVAEVLEIDERTIEKLAEARYLILS